MLQGKLPRNIPLEYPAGLYCCYVVIIVLSIAVVALSVALSEFPKEIQREFRLLVPSAQRVISAPLEVDRQH